MSEGRTEEERRKLLLQIGSAIAFLVVIGVVVAIAINATSTDGGDVDIEGAAEINRELAGVPQSGLVMGDPRAKVLLVEYGDLKCPACAAYADQVIPDLVASDVREGTARLEFRNFTIIDDQSEDAGAAAIAAGEQGRGWNFVEIFYANQGFETEPYADDEFLKAVAEAAGVRDIERWNRARRSAATRDQVTASTEEAEQVGFQGTPSFAVEGPKTGGLEPVEALESPLEELQAAIQRAAGAR